MCRCWDYQISIHTPLFLQHLLMDLLPGGKRGRQSPRVTRVLVCMKRAATFAQYRTVCSVLHDSERCLHLNSLFMLALAQATVRLLKYATATVTVTVTACRGGSFQICWRDGQMLSHLVDVALPL